MKREKRAVRVARRQALLAEVSQSAAMRALADALAEEKRSAALAQRSRTLTSAYGGRSQAGDGATLAQTARFAGALAKLAADAEAARADALAQSQWQSEALGQAQTRARRQSERLESARVAFQSAQDRRENDPSMTAPSKSSAKSSGKGLARLVQSKGEGEPEDPSPGETRQSRTA